MKVETTLHPAFDEMIAKMPVEEKDLAISREQKKLKEQAQELMRKARDLESQKSPAKRSALAWIEEL